ncbi:MAG: low-specificity L-threonine aldolase [Fimbriimonadaceae bacterium]
MIDLRSDTVTRPTPEMYRAMQEAPLGDDVLGDDPTVTELQETAARMLGMEASLYVPSGTMGNQAGLATHCRPGDAAIFESQAHMLYYEVGAPAAIAGVVSWTIETDNGVMPPEKVRAAITKRSIHTPGTRVLCLENTHNRHGGTVIPIEVLKQYREIADEAGLVIHMDGARVFNAAVALGIDIEQITRHVDSISICLSKGLRAPVGSILLGKRGFIEEAAYWRKRLGGGMRQSGILAACGLISLKKYVDRLVEDHENARRLAVALSPLPGLRVDLEKLQTNILMVETDEPAETWVQRLAEKGVSCLPMASHRLRLVTHADVDAANIERAIEAFQELCKATASP